MFEGQSALAPFTMKIKVVAPPGLKYSVWIGPTWRTSTTMRCVAGFLARGPAARSTRCDGFSERSLRPIETQHVYAGTRWTVVYRTSLMENAQCFFAHTFGAN